jgi:hypothetical protein
MATVLDLPRNSPGQRTSSGDDRTRIPSETLKIPKRLESHTAQDDTSWEDSVTEYRVSPSVISDDVLPDVNPLPWRQCAVLMVLASVAVYGLGFVIVAGFSHLFQYLQL